MASCTQYTLAAALEASNPALIVSNDGGVIGVTVPAGETVAEGDFITLFTLLRDDPFFIQWEIGEFNGVYAFGMSFDGSSTLLGSVSNFYYVSDGRVVVNGSVYATLTPLKAGDSLIMWLDLRNALGMFYLNGVRVV